MYIPEPDEESAELVGVFVVDIVVEVPVLDKSLVADIEEDLNVEDDDVVDDDGGGGGGGLFHLVVVVVVGVVVVDDFVVVVDTLVVLNSQPVQ